MQALQVEKDIALAKQKFVVLFSEHALVIEAAPKLYLLIYVTATFSLAQS